MLQSVDGLWPAVHAKYLNSLALPVMFASATEYIPSHSLVYSEGLG